MSTSAKTPPGSTVRSTSTEPLPGNTAADTVTRYERTRPTTTGTATLTASHRLLRVVDLMSERQSIDPTWWDQEHIDGVPMRRVLADRDIKTVFCFLHQRGWSWGALSRATDIGEQRVREIAGGRRRIENYDVYVRIAVGLSIPRDYMGVGLRSPVEPGVLTGATGEREPARCGPLVVDSHKFIPTFTGIDAARHLFGDVRLGHARVGWLECCTMPLHHPDGDCDLYVFECGVAVVHLRQRREPDSLTDLATWRYRSYATDLPWVGQRLTDLLGSARASVGASDYVLSVYWVHPGAWVGPHLDTALRLICAPSVLVDRRAPGAPQPLGEQEERSLLADGFAHPEMLSFGVQGVSIGYAAWSGVAYHTLAPDRALPVDELVACEIIVQMLWCYCDRIQCTVEDGRDPSVPAEYGWRFLRAAYSRLTAARPQETSQHYLMREAIVNTSGVLGKLRAARDALREGELAIGEVSR